MYSAVVFFTFTKGIVPFVHPLFCLRERSPLEHAQGHVPALPCG